MSTSISLNSFINGGNTRIKIVNIITDMTAKTRNKEIDRGIFKPFWIWLDKLHTIFEITKEQIINSMDFKRFPTFDNLLFGYFKYCM